MLMIEPNAKQSKTELNDWYAVYTRHQHEKTVAENFSRNGFEVFLPLYDVVRQWKDRTKYLSLPLFPCYVFFRGGLERRASILSTPGIHSIVTIAGRPAPIPTTEIEVIRTAVNSSLRVEPHPFLRCGDRVRVRIGPLAGVEGILLRKKNICRLILSTTLLERSVAVEVDADCVERVARSIAVPPITTHKVNVFVRESVLG
jgi:transcription antitermination factor NusG